jgi:hypothetical protein
VHPEQHLTEPLPRRGSDPVAGREVVQVGPRPDLAVALEEQPVRPDPDRDHGDQGVVRRPEGPLRPVGFPRPAVEEDSIARGEFLAGPDRLPDRAVQDALDLGGVGQGADEGPGQVSPPAPRTPA